MKEWFHDTTRHLAHFFYTFFVKYEESTEYLSKKNNNMP